MGWLVAWGSFWSYVGGGAWLLSATSVQVPERWIRSNVSTNSNSPITTPEPRVSGGVSGLRDGGDAESLGVRNDERHFIGACKTQDRLKERCGDQCCRLAG